MLKWEMGAELPRNSLSVAKEGKVFEQKKLLQPLLGTPEGTKMTGTIFFLTSPTLTVYSNGQFLDYPDTLWIVRTVSGISRQSLDYPDSLCIIRTVS